ncbi:hypothetical protein HJG60_010686 [Phyllostomus discolor]|uniref:Uncharacterized protein n=1 Tax=Phyllostomus discolor TaxID=89673 RepID=A0A834ANL5_9CHIR|nr:hypothetical protein HJG60_010686 [Phyllostomus discolor]
MGEGFCFPLMFFPQRESLCQLCLHPRISFKGSRNWKHKARVLLLLLPTQSCFSPGIVNTALGFVLGWGRRDRWMEKGEISIHVLSAQLNEFLCMLKPMKLTPRSRLGSFLFLWRFPCASSQPVLPKALRVQYWTRKNRCLPSREMMVCRGIHKVSRRRVSTLTLQWGKRYKMRKRWRKEC